MEQNMLFDETESAPRWAGHMLLLYQVLDNITEDRRAWARGKNVEGGVSAKHEF